MGDMNARFGNAVVELPGRLGCEQYSYTGILDQIQPNDNDNALLGGMSVSGRDNTDPGNSWRI